MLKRIIESNKIPLDALTDEVKIKDNLKRDLQIELMSNRDKRIDRSNEPRIPGSVCMGTINDFTYSQLNPRFSWREHFDLHTEGLHPSFNAYQPQLEDILSLENFELLLREVGPAGLDHIRKRRRIETKRMWCLDYYYRNWNPGKTHCEVCGGFILDKTNIPENEDGIDGSSYHNAYNRATMAIAKHTTLLDFEVQLIKEGKLTHSEVCNYSNHIDPLLPKELRLLKNR